MSLLAVAATCVIASAFGVWAFAAWAGRSRLLDIPNDRSSHQVPTPRGAGIVIVLVVSVAMAWAASAGLFHVDAAAVAALAIAAVSGLDDVRSLPSGLRLLMHVACAVAAVLATSGLVDGSWGPFAIAVAVLWVVGLTNAYNFMDGIDGISGAQAVVAGTAFAVAALFAGNAGAAVAGTAIASASAGFLFHNWSPARVFMGDVGSAFLGFSFAVLALEIGTTAPALGLAAALSLWPFLFDTTVTLLRRAVRGENVLASHRSHLYQRMVIAGWSHSRVSILYAALAIVGAAVACAWAVPPQTPVWILAAVPLMGLGVWAIVLHLESLLANSERAGNVRPSRSG